MIAELSAFEEIAVLCAHLTAYDPRFAAVGRRAEDQQYARHTALTNAGFLLPRPDERTGIPRAIGTWSVLERENGDAPA